MQNTNISRKKQDGKSVLYLPVPYRVGDEYTFNWNFRTKSLLLCLLCAVLIIFNKAGLLMTDKRVDIITLDNTVDITRNTLIDLEELIYSNAQSKVIHKFCPLLKTKSATLRFDHVARNYGQRDSEKKIYIVSNLHSSLIPNLALQISELIRFIHPSNIRVNIYQDNLLDANLEFLTRFLVMLNIEYDLRVDLDKEKQTSLLQTRARIKNSAIQAFRKLPVQWHHAEILFLSNVFFCAGDVLELLLQKRVNRADMACGMDYEATTNSQRLEFSSTWQSRDINGDAFLSYPPDEIVKDAMSRTRFRHNQPFEVFTCWNGISLISGNIITSSNIMFHPGKTVKMNAVLPGYKIYNNCSDSETIQFTKDMIRHGYKKVMIVPSVKVAHNEKSYSLMTIYHPYALETEWIRNEIFSLIKWTPQHKRTPWLFCEPISDDGYFIKEMSGWENVQDYNVGKK